MKHILILLAAFLLLSCTKKSTDAIEGKVTGVVTIDAKLKDTLKPTDVLYIIARNQQFGPPTAVKRVTHPVFPLNYTIGSEDAMMPGTPGFQPGDTLTIAARISRRGDAKPSTGDLEGVYSNNPTKPGTGGVDIVISKARE